LGTKGNCVTEEEIRSYDLEEKESKRLEREEKGGGRVKSMIGKPQRKERELRNTGGRRQDRGCLDVAWRLKSVGEA